MDRSQVNMNMTYSCLLPREKDSKEKIVRVYFERQGENGKNYAECIVPDAIITKSEGFSEEELVQLKSYLLDQKDSITEQARKITGILHYFK